MGKIFCIIGKSSSGKDTIFKELVKDKDLVLTPVIPYTTRPIRCNENQGIEYHFINAEQLCTYQEAGKIIERRDYQTVHGTWSYCTIDDGQIDLGKEVFYLLIVTLEAYDSLRTYFGSEQIIPFYIDVDDGVRLERALKRERKQEKPNYDEVCRRFLADSADFHKDKLEACGIIKGYRNVNLKECIHVIKTDILKIINSAIG